MGLAHEAGALLRQQPHAAGRASVTEVHRRERDEPRAVMASWLPAAGLDGGMTAHVRSGRSGAPGPADTWPIAVRKAGASPASTTTSSRPSGSARW